MTNKQKIFGQMLQVLVLYKTFIITVVYTTMVNSRILFDILSLVNVSSFVFRHKKISDPIVS